MEKKKPYFSIILPIYNVEPYLEACIGTVLEQTFADYELILVDDGSPDNCPEICDRYASAYDHVHVIHKPNGGLSSARNAGLEVARGEYIWFVDSDDWIEKDALQCLYEAGCSDLPDVIKFGYFRVGETLKSGLCSADPGLYNHRESLQSLQQQGFYRPGQYCLSVWSHIYKKEFLNKNDLWFVSERIVGSEDYLFNLEVLAVVESIRVIAEPLYFYRLREGSLTKRYRSNLATQYTALYHHLCTAFEKRNKLEAFHGKICWFYVWHLIHSTYLGHEYHMSEGHSLQDGRRNVRKMFRNNTFRFAVRHCEWDNIRWMQRVQVWAMRMKMEPLFYGLYVVKPKLKRGKCCENKN